MLDQILDATFMYPLVIVLLMGSSELAGWVGRRFHRTKIRSEDIETLTVSTLGLLALLLAFTLSHALSRYEDRRSLVVDEANAIDSTAHLALMLPAQAKSASLSLRKFFHAAGRFDFPGNWHHRRRCFLSFAVVQAGRVVGN
jgi:hypothetical protein